jgi:protein SCO1
MPVGRGAAGEGCGVDRAPRRFMPSPAVHLVMPRMAHLRLAPVLLAVGLIGAGGFAWYQARAAAPPPVARPGSPAPPITLPLLDGGDADLARQRGNVVLLNFWATWCVPCRTEMPALQRLADGLRGERFVLFTVDLQEDAAAIEPFRRELGLGLPVLLDRDGEVTRSYGVRATGDLPDRPARRAAPATPGTAGRGRRGHALERRLDHRAGARVARAAGVTSTTADRTSALFILWRRMVATTRPAHHRRAWPIARPHAVIGVATALVLAGAVGLALVLHVGPWAEPPLEVLWPAPSFTLTDQQHRPFGSADLAGRAALFSFVYTNCPDACPLLTANMAQVQDRLRARGLLGSNVELVSITVDPRRDTPEVLAEYAARYRADPDAWRFLSGEPEAIYQVLWGFKLNTLEVARAFEGADVVPHSDRFAVVDPQGRVRAQPPGDETSPDELVRTLERVVP